LFIGMGSSSRMQIVLGWSTVAIAPKRYMIDPDAPRSQSVGEVGTDAY
jgi:hypothetical protein